MSAKNRYAARVDDNQKAIMRELRAIPGISVVPIGQPVDLLVGYQAKNYLFEVKRPDKIHQPSRTTPGQHAFLKDWRGQVRIVATTDEILQTLDLSYRSTKSQ